MTEDFKEQTKWFTRKLIEVRNREVDGYHLPINFDLSLITSCTVPDFDIIGKTPKDHIVRMLTEIRGMLIKNGSAIPTELHFRELDNRYIEISGYTTELLKIYFKKIFGESPCLFGEGLDDENKVVITYCDKKTDIPIVRNELTVFRCLLKKFDEEVLFTEFFEALNSMRRLLRSPSQSAQKHIENAGGTISS